jgi:hypothetical protein
MQKQAFVGRQEILGLDEIVGASLKSVASAPLKVVKTAVTLPIDVAEWALRKTPTPNKSWFIGREEICGVEDAELVSLVNRKLSTAADNSEVVRSYLAELSSDSLRMANIKRMASAGNSKAKNLLNLIQKATQPRTSSLGREEILGDESGAFVGDDDRILAREGSRSDGAAMSRRIASCGYNSHWNYIRGALPELSAADLAKVQKLAQGGNKKAQKVLARLGKLSQSAVAGDAGPSPDSSDGRQQAKQILSAASSVKSISRGALRRAIWLYAGKSSTEADRTAVGKKMIGLLNERQVRLTN